MSAPVRLSRHRGRHATPEYQDLLTGLVSHWKMDEVSGNRIDIHGGYTLSEDPGAIGLPGVAGQRLNAAKFQDDIDNAPRLYRTSYVVDCSVGLTFGCWIYLPQLVVDDGGGFRLLLLTDAQSANMAIGQVALYAPGLPLMVIHAAGRFLPVSANTWHYVAYVRQAGILTMYCDSQPSISGADDWSGANPAKIGNIGFPDGENNVDYLLIDEMSLWNRALTAPQVASLYNNRKGLAYSSFT